jgi:hypothetical protein
MADRPTRPARNRPPRSGSDTAGEAAALRAARASALEKAHGATLELALAPLLRRVGGEVVRDAPTADDVPVEWLGETLFHVRLLAETAPAPTPANDSTDLSDGLARLITAVEDELGGPLSSLPRAEKQHAVRLLEERGAFEMRRSAETVAEALGLTRFTVYNYLNRLRGSADATG